MQRWLSCFQQIEVDLLATQAIPSGRHLYRRDQDAEGQKSQAGEIALLDVFASLVTTKAWCVSLRFSIVSNRNPLGNRIPQHALRPHRLA